jgi:moderate conductance mechanosensitive channel
VTLRATRIRAVDGTVWHVSNGQTQRAGNMSQHWSRALLDIQIALDSDIDRAREAMKRVADELWREDRAIIEEPELWGVQSLGPSGITIRLVAKTKPLEQWRITRLLRERIKAELAVRRSTFRLPHRGIVRTPAQCSPFSAELPPRAH